MTSTGAGATTPEQITAAVLQSFEACPNPRLRELLQALVRHLHAFASETLLTPAEWSAAIAVLAATGQITTDQRQEFILWSDALGLSMLVDAIAHRSAAAATESTVLGPFWTADAPRRAYGESIVEHSDGSPTLVHGRVLDPAGQPIDGAELDVWQNGVNRLYAVQDADAPAGHLRGRFRSRPDGSYAFLTVRPVPYTIPSDGPVGQMLAATGRHAWRPAHIHLIVTAPAYEKLTTHIFDADSEYLDSDAVFAVKASLVRQFVRHDANDSGRPAGVEGDWYAVENDIVLAPSNDSLAS